MPLAFTGLERINDFSGALEVANELVEAVPASGSFRYWRALDYDRTGKSSQAMVDYMNAIQLFGDPKTVPGHVFYEWAQSYEYSDHTFSVALLAITILIAIAGGAIY